MGDWTERRVCNHSGTLVRNMGGAFQPIKWYPFEKSMFFVTKLRKIDLGVDYTCVLDVQFVCAFPCRFLCHF
jgi:hypothetical protein